MSDFVVEIAFIVPAENLWEAKQESLAILRALAEDGYRNHVWVTDVRPGGVGREREEDLLASLQETVEWLDGLDAANEARPVLTRAREAITRAQM